MNSPSGFQRFLGELRRRHVPQTVAVYAVAAWAAIEFTDVIVGNGLWPESVIVAVIVAAAIGLPAVVVLAWVFDWGPGGVHRTASEPDDEARAEAVGTTRGAASAKGGGYGPWLVTVVVLAVAIGSALAVTTLVTRDPPPEGARAADREPRGTRLEGARDEGQPRPPGPPPGLVAPGYGDSLGRAITDSVARALGETGWPGLDSLMDFARRAGQMAERAGAGAAIEIIEPEPWRLGVPAPLAQGDTLTVRGVARDEAGIGLVIVAGDTVARAERPVAELPFRALLVGTGSRGLRAMAIVARTADDRELRRDFRLVQTPRP